MKAIARDLTASAAVEVKIQHGEETLVFSVSVFTRASFNNDYDVFDHINRFWESLPEARQKQIFNIYKEIHLAFDNIWQTNELFDKLSVLICDLLAQHPLQELQDWVAFKALDIQVPSNFQSGYSHSIDNNTSREKTYTRNDYVQLIPLALLLRTMIPVWGQYIYHIRQDTGTRFKEFYAFQLLNKSGIINSVPMNKLRTYIEHMVGEDKKNPNYTLNHISSEDFGYWLLSLVCIRRLCVSDLRGLDPKANPVTFIYQFIIQKLRNNENNIEEVVKPKTFDDRGPENENKISTLERYKIKTNISVGEIVELEYSLRNISDVASKLSFRLDPNMLQRSIGTSRALMSERLLDPQMTLLRWVFKPAISAKGLLYLPKPMIVDAIGALEAILWSRGHKYLAVLASSYPAVSDKLLISPTDSKMQVPDELVEKLNQIYPFVRQVTARKSTEKEPNLSMRSINTLSSNLMQFVWRPTAHEDMLIEVFGSPNRKVPILPDIKTYLTKLVIELGERSWM